MSRTLVVGWDGGTWSVADPLLSAGRLPALASLLEGGARGTLESVPNMNSAPAWSTIATGVDPGRHGIFYFDERVPGTYGRRIINAERRAAPTLWRMCSEAGKRVLVVNVPISYPAEAVNGILVAGLGRERAGRFSWKAAARAVAEALERATLGSADRSC